MKNIDLIATSTFGVESIVVAELKDLGYDNLKVSNGKVEFKGELKDICKTNLWLRCADRVLLKIAEFKATSFDELFENTKTIPWSDFFPKKAKFPVSKVASVKSKLFSKSDSQAIVKKAIVESMKNSYGIKWFEETGPEYPIKLEILKDVATLGIDTGGTGLHKRGYRASGDQAPIKETLAATLVKLSKWKAGENFLIDPTCGTGTILIEAAMIGKNIAPGKNRNFLSEQWDFIPQKLWKQAREDTLSLEKNDIDLKIYGSDINGKALKTARENIKLAGFENCIFVQKLALADISSKYKYGTIICNPPYGERISEKKEVEKLYKEMGHVFKEKFNAWSYYILTSNTDFERLFGKKASKNRKLYNGGIKCYFYQYPYNVRVIHELPVHLGKIK